MRSRAAPMGISVMVCSGSAGRAGLACNGVTTFMQSACQLASCRAGAVMVTGAGWVNGLAGSAPPAGLTVSALAGSEPLRTSP